MKYTILIALVVAGCCWSYTPPRVTAHNLAVFDKAVAQTQTNGGTIVFARNGMGYMVVGGRSNALDLIEWPPGRYNFR